MRYTLLEMVQRILAAMDSDEVTGINDTTESAQVALLIEGVYYDLLSEVDLPETGSLFELNSPASGSTPTIFTIPDEIIRLSWVKYDNITTGETYSNWKEVQRMDLKDFLEMTNEYGKIEDTDLFGTFDYSITNGDNTDTIQFFYRKDLQPQWYTSFDDGTLVFNSLDMDVDASYLTKAKTQCWGIIEPTFTQDDNFIPNLDTSQFSLLMNEAKARAFVELKQISNANAEAHARRLRVRLRNTKNKVPGDYRPFRYLPNYGRK